MSIKLKIALYNTFLVAIIVSLLLYFMIWVSGDVVSLTSENQLKSVVQDNADEIEWDDGELEIDDIDFIKAGITTLVYDSNGVWLGGYINNIQNFTAPLTHDHVTQIFVDGEEFLMYDFFVNDRRYDGIYLRGIVSVREVADFLDSLLLITIGAMPLFILLAGVGSYLISKKSMQPLEKIIDTAEDISNGNDLSQRINLGQGKDEIHCLADVFDNMFSQLEQAFVAEKQFSSDVSHELRTPTAVILAECECSLSPQSSETEKNEALAAIQRQAKRMNQIITALLSLIRLDNGVQKINLEPTDLSELVAIVCSEHQSIILPTQQLLTELPPELLCSVDYSLMIRVVSNLVENGFKYGSDTSFVKVVLQDVGDNVTVIVSDNGIGIDQQHLPKIFNRFYQVESSRTGSSAQSMGLGLSMVQKIVTLHGGNITVSSELGSGTTFTVLLPKNLH